MASSSGGQPVLAAVPPPPENLTTSFATILNSKNQSTKINDREVAPSILKNPDFVNGRYTISWHSKEVQQSVIATGLEYAIIGKFKYGNPDIHELRKVIPLQCGIKGEVNIGFLESRLILIRCTIKEDYINLLSSSGFWLKLKNDSVHMRTLKWDIWYDSKKETAISVAWISFPNLPPNFFARDFVYSLAMAVGKPLTVDMATKNNTRPSCARVKVEVNLLKDLPQEIDVGEHNDIKEVIDSKTVRIRYDYLPKYCKKCYLQGHDEEGCYSLHPELYRNKHVQDMGQSSTRQIQQPVATLTDGRMESVKEQKQKAPAYIVGEHNSLFKSGRLVYTEQQRHEWQQVRMKKKNTALNDGQSKVFQSKNAFRVLHDQQDMEEGQLANGNTVLINDTTNERISVDNVGDREEEGFLDEGFLDEVLKSRTDHLRQARDKAVKSSGLMDKRNDGSEMDFLENDGGGNNIITMDGPPSIKRKENENPAPHAHVFDQERVITAPHAPMLKSGKHMQAQQRVASRAGVGEVTFDPDQHARLGVENTVGFLECIDNSHQNANKEAENAQCVQENGSCSVQQLFNSSKKKASCKELVNTSFQKMGQQITMASPIDAVNNTTLNEGNLVSKDRTNAAQADKIHSAEMSTREISTNPRANEAQTGGEDAGEMNVERLPLNTECYSIPSESPQELTGKNQSEEHEPQSGGSSMQTSPSHSSNVLIPPQDLEVIFKLNRLLKGTSDITMEIAKKLSNEERLIILKRDEDRTLCPILTYIREGLIAPPEELAQKKAIEPTNPMRVQPTRSSKSNSTRGK